MDPGISDEEVLHHANLGDRILLTADKDFGELIFRHGRTASGVVLIRLEGLSPTTKSERIAAVARQRAEEFVGNFAVITPGTVRIRRSMS